MNRRPLVMSRFFTTPEPTSYKQHVVNWSFSRERLWGSLALVGSNFLGNSWVKSGWRGSANQRLAACWAKEYREGVEGPVNGRLQLTRPCRTSHQRRLSSPPASALPERYADAVTTSSSVPSRVGKWDSHQRTSRISRLGSASGSQPGQYARATQGVSGR